MDSTLRFFNGIRLMLAAEYSQIVLGEVMVDAIKNIYLPELEGRLAGEDDPRKAGRLEKLIEQWTEYSEGGRRNEWAKTAIAKIRDITKRFKGGPQDIADIAQNFAGNFYTKDNWRRWLTDRVDPEKGPGRAKAEWTKLINNNAMSYWRDRDVAEKRKAEPRRPGEPDPVEQVPGKAFEVELSDLDRGVLNLVKKDLVSYVRRNARDDISRELFRLWFEAAKDKGAHNIKPEKDMYPHVDVGRSAAWGRWKEVRRLIPEFFAQKKIFDKYGISLTQRAQRQMGLGRMSSRTATIADSLAGEEYFKQLASWVLGPYRRIMDAGL